MEPRFHRFRISWFSLAGEAELTGVHTRGEAWWTLGFAAPGPASLLRSELEATAALVFAHGPARGRGTRHR